MAKKCKNCKCNDKVVVTPATPCIAPCAKPPCENVFDIQCVNYTGDAIVCKNETIVEPGESLPTVLSKLVDKICNKVNCDLQVTFNYDVAEATLWFDIANGQEPFVIKESIVSGPFSGMKFRTIPDGTSILLQTANGFGFEMCCNPIGGFVNAYDPGYKFNTTTVKLDITDNNGCNTEVYYTIVINSEDCLNCVN